MEKSSQLTFSPSFFRGVGQPPTRDGGIEVRRSWALHRDVDSSTRHVVSTAEIEGFDSITYDNLL